MMSFEEQFTAFYTEHKLFTRNQRILVAVSGGIDSVVLVHLLASMRVPLGIAHCNFGLRGGESDADELFVESLATQLNVPFYKKSFDTRKYAENQGISTQMAARDLRYAWFHELIDAHGFDLIAIANQKNDDIETAFINLTRGTGIKGITGIPVKKGKVIRPLLFAKRSSIKAYAKREGVNWREDSSNASTHYVRNKIRHEVIPVLQSINPDLENTFSENMERFQQVEALLNGHTAALRKRVLTTTPNGITIKSSTLQKEQHLALMLFELLREYGFNRAQVRSIEEALIGIPGKQFFSATHRLLIDRESLMIEPLNSTGNTDPVRINRDTQSISHPIGLTFKQLKLSEVKLTTTATKAYLDADKLLFPIKIRPWKSGDQFKPLGMKGNKKLSDFFIDKKVPVHIKERTFVLESAGEIAWVIGHRISETFKIGDDTENVYLVSIKQ